LSIIQPEREADYLVPESKYVRHRALPVLSNNC